MIKERILQMKIEGYHNTEVANVEDILQHGFIYKENDKHWLGQGIYFFSDIDTATINLDMLTHENEIDTIAVEIEVEESQFLDLDNSKNLNSFRSYCQRTGNDYEKKGYSLIIDEPDKKKAMLKYKCFFMDLFKQEYDYVVVSKTFAKDNPPYAEPIEGIKYLGLSFLETYICVGCNEYIVKKNLVEREWIV